MIHEHPFLVGISEGHIGRTKTVPQIPFTVTTTKPFSNDI